MSVVGRPTQHFTEDLYQFISQLEGVRSHVYSSDGKGVPTIGTGYALIEKINGKWQIRDGLQDELQAAGVTPLNSDRRVLDDIAAALNDGNISLATSLVTGNPFSFSIDAIQARQLFDYVVPGYEEVVRQKIGEDLYQQLAGSQEMVALVSLAYNSPSLIGQNLVKALQDGNRAEAWYEIRYNSNLEGSNGIAKRRYDEADMFGLWTDKTNPSATERENFATMVERHWPKIAECEARFGRVDPNDGHTSALELAISEFKLSPDDVTLKGICSKMGVDLDLLIKEKGSLRNALRYFKEALNGNTKPGWSEFSWKVLSRLSDLFVNKAHAATDPLILDLDGDGIETTHLKDGAYFDHGSDGFAERTGWAAPDDGLLVLDRTGDGIITDGRELFGDSTILKDGATAAHGFAALAEWDEHADGTIDSTDTIWSQLRIWQETPPIPRHPSGLIPRILDK